MSSSFRVAAFFLALGCLATDGQEPSFLTPGSRFSDVASPPMLPPLKPWNGKSRALIVSKNDPWITPAEMSDFRTTPSYDETVSWLRKLVAAAPELKMISLGKSPDGRDIWMVIASREKEFTPEGLGKSGKSTILAQDGIHP